MRLQPFQALLPKMDKIADTAAFFANIKEDYLSYSKQGFFEKNTQEAFYLYRIQRNKQAFTGIIAGTSILDFLEGKIKKHEKTVATKEKCQIQLMEQRKASVKPILLTYPPTPSISQWIREYTQKQSYSMKISTPGDQEIHLIWKVTGQKAINTLQNLFVQHVPISYIADGHHRISTSASMYQQMTKGKITEQYHQLLCAFFDTSQLKVYEFNRVLKGLTTIQLNTLLDKLSNVCTIEKLKDARRSQQKHELILFIHQHCYSLKWKESLLKQYKNQPVILDTMLLNEVILKKILKIKDQSIDSHVDYIEGPKGLEGLRKKVGKNPLNIGFQLFPINIEDLLQIMDTDKILPPKSTWFDPRMKNGLVVLEHIKPKD